MSDSSPLVLVVDDNADFLRVAQAVLETGTPSFAVSAVRSGVEAISFLLRRAPFEQAARPSFVVLDFRLPDIDAPAVLDTLKGQLGMPRTPVLVLSQARWEADERAVMQADATRFCVKPSSVRALRELFADFYEQCVAARQEENGHGSS
jgi:CheY-like chemotaxis protein